MRDWHIGVPSKGDYEVPTRDSAGSILSTFPVNSRHVDGCPVLKLEENDVWDRDCMEM